MVIDPLVVVTEDDRAVAHAQVDVLVAVDVPDATALAPIDVDGVVAPGPEVGVRPTGEGPQGTLVHRRLGGAPKCGRGAGGGLGGHEGPLCGSGGPVHETVVAHGGTQAAAIVP